MAEEHFVGFDDALKLLAERKVSGTVKVHYAGSTSELGVGVLSLLSSFRGRSEVGLSDLVHPNGGQWQADQQRDWLGKLEAAHLVRRTCDGTYVITATARHAQYDFKKEYSEGSIPAYWKVLGVDFTDLKATLASLEQGCSGPKSILEGSDSKVFTLPSYGLSNQRYFTLEAAVGGVDEECTSVVINGKVIDSNDLTLLGKIKSGEDVAKLFSDATAKSEWFHRMSFLGFVTENDGCLVLSDEVLKGPYTLVRKNPTGDYYLTKSPMINFPIINLGH